MVPARSPCQVSRVTTPVPSSHSRLIPPQHLGSLRRRLGRLLDIVVGQRPRTVGSWPLSLTTPMLEAVPRMRTIKTAAGGDRETDPGDDQWCRRPNRREGPGRPEPVLPVRRMGRPALPVESWKSPLPHRGLDRLARRGGRPAGRTLVRAVGPGPRRGRPAHLPHATSRVVAPAGPHPGELQAAPGGRPAGGPGPGGATRG
jgi:hypothetical protein